MNTDTPKKTAAHWLGRACSLEREGSKTAEAAYRRAEKLDAEEHLADPATASLPRKAA